MWPASFERWIRRLRRLGRRLWPRPPRLRIEAVGAGGVLCLGEPEPFIEAYQEYCVELSRHVLAGLPEPPWLAFGASARARAPARCLNIELQWEHTLVLPGGRDSDGAPPGTVVAAGSPPAHYLVRIAEPTRLRGADLVIDYSRPNLRNLAGSPGHAWLLARSVAIAPLLFRLQAQSGQRDIALLGLFADTRAGRRRRFIDEARAVGLPLRCVQGVYSRTGLRALYGRTRILVNLHQTDHHHTLEELRVLPALLCGVVVVSEEVPLREQVPYQRFIIWAARDRLIEVLQEVERDYARHWQRIFGDPGLASTLQQLQQDNQQALAAGIARAMENARLSRR